MTDTGDDKKCGICGDVLSTQFCETLRCGHIFHYECILKTFKINKTTGYGSPNRCPYCRQKSGYLPPVNGLSKLIPKIHYPQKGPPPPYQSTRCSHTLKRGKNKGQECGKKCQVGYDICKPHRT